MPVNNATKHKMADSRPSSPAGLGGRAREPFAQVVGKNNTIPLNP